jgi:hypothetical protein
LDLNFGFLLSKVRATNNQAAYCSRIVGLFESDSERRRRLHLEFAYFLILDWLKFRQGEEIGSEANPGGNWFFIRLRRRPWA